jgi:hypothetical protein
MPLGHGHRDYGRFARGRGANLFRLADGAPVEGTAAPALGELRVTLERIAEAPRTLALYARGVGAPEHLPRGWGAHDAAPANPRAAGQRPASAAAPEPEDAEGGSP